MPEATTQKDDAGATAASDSSLLTITDEAAERLEDEMAEHEGTQALRLLVQGGCCGMQYAMAMAKREAEASERVVTSNGIRVYVDEEAVDLIDGTTVDWTEGVFGAGFHVDNPNADAAGGCGCK